MTNLLLIRCKVKVMSSLGMIIFGGGLTAFCAWLIKDGSSWWWLIGVFLGVFCLYQWTSILIKGGMSIAFLVKDGVFYLTYERTKKVVANLEEIRDAQFFTRKYDLASISHFWKYTFKVNGGTTTEDIKVVYKGKEETFIDLNEHELRLKDQDLDKMVRFMMTYQPTIRFGKP